MAVPTLTARIDWNNDGDFGDAIESLSGRVLDCSWTRGRSADFSSEATGSASLLLDNFDDRFTPDRNWHDNPSFEDVATGWSVLAIASLTAAATSIGQVTDNATAATGTKAGEAVLTATVNSGVAYPIPYTFRSGVTYAVSVYLKSTAGNLNVRAGLASAGTPADIASSGANITTSWAAYTFTWTPSADRTDAVFFVRTTTAATATVRIDAVQVNPGSAANTYIEAPTRGQLVPGRPVHIYATYSATDYPQFYGFIERLAPNPADRTVSLTCYDVLRRMSETDVVVAASSLGQRSAHDFRVEVLGEYERGNRNLLPNPSFETATTGWTASDGTLTRLTTDAAAGAGGTCCGEFVWSSGTAYVYAGAYLANTIWTGTVYRASVWLRTTSGTLDVTLGLGYTLGAPSASERVVTLTTTWTRYSLTYTPATTYAPNVTAMNIYVSLTSGTVRIDGAQITRGQGLLPYADSGTGRWPNWCGSGSFDGGAENGWLDGFANLIGNPSFETDVSGWAGSLTRATGDAQYGTAHATIADMMASGVTYNLTGTFKAGVTYDYRLGIKDGTSYATVTVKLQSSGTPADASAAGSPNATTSSWQTCIGSWTPSADRTDAQMIVTTTGPSSGNVKIDGAMVTRRDSGLSAGPNRYSDTGPGGGGSAATSTAIVTTPVKYGSRAYSVTTPATATAGTVYDFKHSGVIFASGQPYTLSLWLRAADAMPYKVGIGANKGDGTWDEASATGTLTDDTWTQVTVTWTPTDLRTSLGVFDTVAYVYQTGATARTFYVDGVRVIPGSAADDFEMAHWTLAAEPDTYSSGASLTGTALSCLGTLNDLALTRNWIEPAMAAPWYAYVTSGRSDTKASAETFDNDMTDLSAADIDRASIINVVPVTSSVGTDYYSDAASVERYGTRPGGTISGSAYFVGATIPDAVGPSLVARYRDPRARPTMTIVNRFPSQLQRELDDLVTVNFARLNLTGGRYLILRMDTTVGESGQRWQTLYTLEEAP